VKEAVAERSTGEKAPMAWMHWAPFLIAVAIFALDRVTKIYIRANVHDFDSISVIPGWLRIMHTENSGAAFGMLADGAPLLRGIVLIGISVVVLFFVISALLNRNGSYSGRVMRIGLGFVLGGAIGNLYDRILLGRVTDFIEVYNGTWSFPAFNVADSAITVGAAILIFDLLRPHRKPVPAPAESK
jgi:signal peptidase II